MDWFNPLISLHKNRAFTPNGFLSISGLFNSENIVIGDHPKFWIELEIRSDTSTDCSLGVCWGTTGMQESPTVGKRRNHVCSQLQTSQLSPRLQQTTLGSLRSTSPADTRTADCRDPRNPVLGRGFWSIRKTLRTTSWHNWHWVLGSKGKPWLSILQKHGAMTMDSGLPGLTVKPSRVRWPQLEPP